MRLFDIAGYSVVIHPDALALPPFKKIWDNNSEAEATDKIRYIILNNHPDSPYVKGTPEAERKRQLTREIFGDVDDISDDVKESEAEYVSLMDTLSSKMLRAIRSNLETMSASLESMKTMQYSLRDMKDILSISDKASSAIRSIKDLEDQVRAENINMNKVRGGGAIGRYEIPKTSRK